MDLVFQTWKRKSFFQLEENFNSRIFLTESSSPFSASFSSSSPGEKRNHLTLHCRVRWSNRAWPKELCSDGDKMNKAFGILCDDCDDLVSQPHQHIINTWYETVKLSSWILCYVSSTPWLELGNTQVSELCWTGWRDTLH